MADENNHIELQPALSEEQSALARIKILLARLVNRLSALDGVSYTDYSINDQNRIQKQILNAILRKWKNDLDLQSFQHIHWALDEIETVHGDAVVCNRVIPGDQSSLAQLFGPPSSPDICAEDWALYRMVERRQSQIVNANYRYDNEVGIFMVDLPQAYRCSQCLTNDHSLAQCISKLPTCLKCKRLGHIAAYCKWQLCANCKMYGHGRQRCETVLEGVGPACLKCGRCGHDPHGCPNTGTKYCRVCRGNHSMYHCQLYIDMGKPCFIHCGSHKYEDCPDFGL